MANPNISFYRQTTGSTAKGAVTFDTTNKYIYLGDGSTAHKFNCNNTVYTHPTTAGNKHIPSGGSSGQILRWSSDGTAVWGADHNTTYSGSSNFGISIVGNVVYQTQPTIASASSGGKLGQLDLSTQLNSVLTEWYESSPQGSLCVTVTIESAIVNADWISGNHIIGTAHLVFPSKGSLLNYVDSTDSDRSDNVYLFSTPFMAATGASGVGQCVLKVLYGGSTQSGTWRVHSATVVNATTPTTGVDTNKVVSIGYVVNAWRTY